MQRAWAQSPAYKKALGEEVEVLIGRYIRRAVVEQSLMGEAKTVEMS